MTVRTVEKTCMIEVTDLAKVYPNGVKALQGIELSLEPGVHAIMGPNGSGKTTFLNIMAGALAPTRGNVRVCGYSVWGEGWRTARRLLGYAPQDAPLRDRLTVIENLVWYGSLRGMGIGESRERAREVLKLLGLEDKENERINRLSGGMRRRVAIASALMASPRILLLDEPSSGLDPGARRELWEHLHLLVSKGMVEILVYTTHIAQEAEEHSDRVHIFHRGRMVASGFAEELVKQYAPSSRVVLEAERLTDDSWIRAVDGVEAVDVEGTKLIVYTREPEQLMPRLIDQAFANGITIVRAEVSRPGLEDVFYALTGTRLEEKPEWGGVI